MHESNAPKHKYVEFFYSITVSNEIILEQTETPYYKLNGCLKSMCQANIFKSR